MDPADVSDRTKACVEAVVERGQFKFEDKETFGDYMLVLQRANQAIFADQKKLLQKIKDIKKAASAPAPVAQVATPARTVAAAATGGADGAEAEVAPSKAMAASAIATAETLAAAA